VGDMTGSGQVLRSFRVRGRRPRLVAGLVSDSMIYTHRGAEHVDLTSTEPGCTLALGRLNSHLGLPSC
jgi:hypothetical protein